VATPVPLHLDEGQTDYDDLSGASPALVNMLVIGKPGVGRPIRTRPGIRPWSGFPSSYPSTSPVVAIGAIGDVVMYVTDDGFGTRDVFMINGGVVVPLSSDSSSRIAGTDPVSIAIGRDIIVAAGGGEIQKIAPGVSARLGGSPPQATDVAFIAQYLVAIQKGLLGLFFWSNPGAGGIETWTTGVDFREAEARPDELIGCEVSSRELWMFGRTTTQIFVPDESEIFAPRDTLETGIRSKTSIIRYDRAMAWHDDADRVAFSGGGEPSFISERGIAGALKGLADPADVWGFRAVIGHHDLATWCYRGDGRAFTWDAISQAWSEWRRWKDGRWQPWAPTAHYWWEKNRVHLVGMPDGSIAELSLDAHSDLDDPIKWNVRTSFREMGGRKHCVEARFPVSRGGAGAGIAEVSVRWRDDHGAFCDAISAEVGAGGADPDVVISPAGEPSKRRQWELSGDGSDAYLLNSGTAFLEDAEF
jgi:hypothetical protein